MIQVIDDEVRVEEERQFGPEQEKSIISLAFDIPEFFAVVGQHLDSEYFQDLPTKFVFTLIEYHFNKHGVVIPRKMCRDEALKQLTSEDNYEEVLAVIDRKSDPREIPIIKETLIEWCRQKAYSLLYSEAALSAHDRGDYGSLEEIFEGARKITDISSIGISFFDSIDGLFEENNDIHLPTGFDRLDAVLNEGGPTYGDVFVWMAPTGVGKSIMLVNSGVACLRKGLNVLHVTLELSEKKTALRYMGSMTDHHIKRRKTEEGEIRKKLQKFSNTYGSRLQIIEFPPDDISVDTIHAILDNCRRQHGIKFDVVIIDYLELLISRERAYNSTGDEYNKQKKVSTEIRSLAKKEKVLVYTASQTNRSGTETDDAKGGERKVIGLNKVAESYGKTMPLDYIVTINQSKKEYEEGRLRADDPDSPNIRAIMRFFVAKNRNGPKFMVINARINYETMRATQEQYF